jgi:predicted metal-dependent hydrolase
MATKKKVVGKDDDSTAWPVEIIRSKKRRKTVSGELKNGVLVIRAPARISDTELAPIIENLRRRMVERKRPKAPSDQDLEKRARELNRRYFNGRLQWQSIRYVTNQNKRFGSCTPSAGTIRISHRLAKMPDWVLKYVVLHELAHLEEANHGRRFWRLVNQYPLTERARGYLMAVGLEEEEGNEVDELLDN